VTRSARRAPSSDRAAQPRAENAITVWPMRTRSPSCSRRRPVQADAVDPRAVLRPAVVGDRPLPRPVLELRVQARDLRVPRQREVGLEATADGQRAGLSSSSKMCWVPLSSR
jgi:hypothetical protein